MKSIKNQLIFLLAIIFFGCQQNHNSSDDGSSTKEQAIYLNPNANIDDRIDDLLSIMTLEEKAAQLNAASIRKSAAEEEGVEPIEKSIEEQIKNGIGFIENTFDQRLPEQSVAMVNSLQKFLKEETHLGIPAIIGTECLHGHAGRNSTVFPTPLAMSSSWNTKLVNEVFDVIGREARARGGHEAHTSVLDIGRDPRWGRIEESYGEDTYLTTQMALSIISGLQGGNTGNPGLTHIISSPKHFAGYGQVEGGRNFAATPIDNKILYDEILPPFKAVVEQTNGDALAKVIFGDVNPSGKLAISFLHNAGQIPFYYSMKGNSFYKGYWETPPTPVYAFGHGLSYTSFEYADLTIEKEAFNVNEAVKFSVKVKNTGKTDGAEDAQVYFRDKVASVTRPAKLLVRFEKVWLKAGEEKTLAFSLNPGIDLSFTGIDLKRIVEPGEFNLMVGSASDDIRLEKVFSLK